MSGQLEKLYDGKSLNYNLAFSLRHTAFVDEGVRQGLLAGIAVLLAMFLVSRIQSGRWRWIAVLVAAAVLFPLGVLGFWYSTGKLGIADWDLNKAVQDSYRIAILNYRQLPLWNPLACGGGAGLANPENSIFSLPFLFVLLAGTLTGFKMGILFSIIVLAMGMIILGKAARLTPLGAFLASLTVVAGSAFVLRLVEGHVYIAFAYAWIPWVLWGWYKAYANFQFS
ncbi:MAG: hypothetical protein U1C49_02460 [Candidatus Andersenbacteria bacterium]|nr:hypothetical protein [bacterium]MDZ4225690.1 hypothetical protein [Candidatus Andersenbacteria bacterium]